MRNRDEGIPDHIRRFRQRRHPVMSRLHGDWSEGGRALSVLARRWARRRRRQWTLVLILAGFVVSFAMMVWGIWAWRTLTHENAAQLGDLVGGFAGGLGFLGMVAALWMQTRELRLQREELTYQREELRLTRAEIAAQTQVLAEQVRASESHADLVRAEILAKGPPVVQLEQKIEQVTDGARVTYSLFNEGPGRIIMDKILVAPGGFFPVDLNAEPEAHTPRQMTEFGGVEFWPTRVPETIQALLQFRCARVDSMYFGYRGGVVDPGARVPLVHLSIEYRDLTQQPRWEEWSFGLVAQFFANVRHGESRGNVRRDLNMGDVMSGANLEDGESEHPLPE